MSEKKEKQLTVSQIIAKGKENLNAKGIEWRGPGDKIAPCMRANRRYLEELFFEPKFFDPVEVDTSCTFLGMQLQTPVFCSAISRMPYMAESAIADIAKGVASAGSFFMFGMGGSADLQSAIDTKAPVVKIVKPFQKTELIYEEVRDAENRGCVAVGMDIDHFYGVLVGDMVGRTNTFGPQSTNELKQVISGTKLPFIVKGVLSISDAEKAAELGAKSVLVSNHSSGAFDFTVPAMVALPKIADRVGKKMTVLIDSGFENGNDVFKAMAYGAKAVGFGSSMCLALEAGEADGVELLIRQITAELRRAMAATGCHNLSAINKSFMINIPIA